MICDIYTPHPSVWIFVSIMGIEYYVFFFLNISYYKIHFGGALADPRGWVGD